MLDITVSSITLILGLFFLILLAFNQRRLNRIRRDLDEIKRSRGIGGNGSKNLDWP